mmetsp:Transcript_81841/g.226788  ORF Transcript_81841/g.226788 Transcript_81841/m.226788 type:complete len:383 (+) Transcript_81841:66-1214(+)
MVTAIAANEAGSKALELDEKAKPEAPEPDRKEALLAAAGLWEAAQRACARAPLEEAAPRGERLRRMVHLQCWSLSQSAKPPNIQELWAAEATAEESVGAAVVDSIREITRHLTWSVQEERVSAAMEVHVRSNSAIHLDTSRALCEQFLWPLVGQERAQAIWSMCHRYAWHVQNSKQQYHADAQADRLWVDHYVRRMGFDEDAAPLLGNCAVVALCYHASRRWTSEHVADGTAAREELRPREAAFEIALAEARGSVPAVAADAIAETLEQLRLGAHLERLADRKHPTQLVANLLQGTKTQATAAFGAARKILDARLVPLLGGERAEEVWQTCHSCAWFEQNRYDYESAIGGRITGARNGYLRSAQRDWESVLEHAQRMGFDAA